MSPRGRLPFLRKPPCPRYKVPLTLQGRFPSWEIPPFPHSEIFSAPQEEPSPGNVPFPYWEVNSTPQGRHSPPKCPQARTNFWPPPWGHLLRGKH